ncbi:MAG: HDOD domain-containing protein [Georgfuchsia sp.]
MAQTIGRFEIRRELGRGAQSIVYLAWDPQLQREVAIKTMHFSHSDAGLNQMLLSEARMVSKLRHANVVPIFDAGEQNGDPYLVFELVEGRTLSEALRTDGPLEPVIAADMMRKVLDALAQAHAQGIIHRDLKPSNILLDSGGVPRVMDFGIAARVNGSDVKAQETLMGTPAYMAPEYVEKREVSAKGDVYAAGLILLEMLTGKRAIQGDMLPQILYRILNGRIALPPGIDGKLGNAILKACDKDVGMRFADAAQMRHALDDYLGAGQTVEGDTAVKQSTLDFLLRRMRHKSEFPALSDSVSAINKLTNSDKESINKLSNTILRDYALTNKILRIVNTAYFRQAGGGNISTVSRAVIVLGFDAIRNIAITVLLFEHMQDKGSARDLKESFLRSNLAALVARDASSKFMARDTEEAFICAMFRDLGQLLALYYFPEEVDAIRILMQQKQLSETVASTQVLGISLEELEIEIARGWGFPPSIVNSMRSLPEGLVKKPETRDEMLRVVSSFANEVCILIASTTNENRADAIRALSSRFNDGMMFPAKQLQKLVERSSFELEQIATTLHVNLKQSPFACQIKAFTRQGEPKAVVAGQSISLGKTLADGGMTLVNDPIPDVEGSDEAEGCGNSESVLTAGIQDISNSLVDDFSLNDILRIILETMYRAIGFKRVLFCLKDVRNGMMAGRFGFGPDTAEIVKHFRFPLAYAPDVFHLSSSKGADILISNIDDAKIADKIPAWYRQNVPARTFVLLPLNIKHQQLALIYCDMDKPGAIVFSERELQLLKTLRNQAVLAIKQAG